jgi:hypothetical protein
MSAFVAIDMPLVHTPIVGRRVSDDAVSRAYAGRKCGTHTPNALRPGRLSEHLRQSFDQAGYPLLTNIMAPVGLIGPIPLYLTRLQQRLEAHGGRYFAADRLSVADLKVLVWIRHLRSGALDHVPTDLTDRVAPRLVEHYERVKNDPGVKAYYAKHGIAG